MRSWVILVGLLLALQSAYGQPVLKGPVYVGLSGGIGENKTILGSLLFGGSTDYIVNDMSLFSGISLSHVQTKVRSENHTKSNTWMTALEGFFGWKYILAGFGLGVLWFDEAFFFVPTDDALSQFSKVRPFASFGGMVRYEYVGVKIMKQLYSGWSGELMITVPVKIVSMSYD